MTMNAEQLSVAVARAVSHQDFEVIDFLIEQHPQALDWIVTRAGLHGALPVLQHLSSRLAAVHWARVSFSAGDEQHWHVFEWLSRRGHLDVQRLRDGCEQSGRLEMLRGLVD